MGKQLIFCIFIGSLTKLFSIICYMENYEVILIFPKLPILHNYLCTLCYKILIMFL
jgi:hypothetical protein